jgi:hypothetical protein
VAKWLTSEKPANNMKSSQWPGSGSINTYQRHRSAWHQQLAKAYISESWQPVSQWRNISAENMSA